MDKSSAIGLAICVLLFLILLKDDFYSSMNTVYYSSNLNTVYFSAFIP